MPIYEYYCTKCGKEFDLMRPMSQYDDPAKCPTCGSKAEKLVTAAASKVDFYIKPLSHAPFRQLPKKEGQKQTGKTRSKTASKQ